MSHVSLAADRVQTGVRLEKRLVKVLKALAALQDLSLGDLLENIVHYHGLLHLLGDDGAEFMAIFTHGELESLDPIVEGNLRRLPAARPRGAVGAAYLVT
jgi:hypothetical protein